MRTILFNLTAVIAVALVCSSASQAAIVSYQTSGVFDSNNTDTISVSVVESSVTVEYQIKFGFTPEAYGPPNFDSDNGVPETFVQLPAVKAYMGDFTVTRMQGAPTVNPAVPVSDTFTLTVNQLDPLGGPEDIAATVSGSVKVNDGIVAITFATTSFSFGNVTYVLGNLAGVPLSSNGNTLNVASPNGTATGDKATTYLTASIDAPEPASLAVWGLFGLAGAGGAWRRRRKAALAA